MVLDLLSAPARGKQRQERDKTPTPASIRLIHHQCSRTPSLHLPIFMHTPSDPPPFHRCRSSCRSICPPLNLRYPSGRWSCSDARDRHCRWQRKRRECCNTSVRIPNIHTPSGAPTRVRYSVPRWISSRSKWLWSLRSSCCSSPCPRSCPDCYPAQR